jgi:hypothetical protein
VAPQDFILSQLITGAGFYFAPKRKVKDYGKQRNSLQNLSGRKRNAQVLVQSPGGYDQ